jgi:hypothetical protein
MGVPFSKGKITGFAAGTPDLLETQASAVSDTCNLWVPRYNQVGMLSLSQSMPGVKAKNIQKFKAAMALAYDDLAAAFRAFLANRPDKKRPFIILAHSQGSILMVKVSRRETTPHRITPHRTAPHRTAPFRTESHRTAPHRITLHRSVSHHCCT